MNMINVNHLNKKFQDKTVLLDVSFSIQEGRITGILGKNGAGKTILLKILLNLIDKTSGTVDYTFQNKHIAYGNRALYRNVAAVLESVDNLYDYLTGRQNINYFLNLSGISPASKTSEINSLFKKFDLSSAIDQRVGQYSRGMKQKLALISCLVSNASLLFLDEPTLGLDFVASRTLIRQIKEINQQLHKTIILTSHQADVLEKLVDDVLLIDNQKVRFFGPYEEFQKTFSSFGFVVVSSHFSFKANNAITVNSSDDGKRVTTTFKTLKDQQEFLKKLLEHGITVHAVQNRYPSLDELLRLVF